MEVVTRLRGGGCGGSKSAVSVKPVPAVGLPAAAKAQTQRKQEIEKEIEGLKTALAAERERSQWQAQGLACFQPCLAPVATAPIAMKSAPSAARRGSVASRPFDKTRGSGRALGGLSLSVVIFGATGDLARKKLFPALYQLVLHGYLPRVGLNIIGYGRSPVVLKDFLAKQCVNYVEVARPSEVLVPGWAPYIPRLH